ncbi:uncharacterized protein si:ch211-284e13.6 [Electrophorus electricus]|uniref:uncharacterized protein si:ch211-284e13.6 n=1 Tax=Electrophorus electricus TaxID=8005 RepID=UPI0015D02D0D|nr:uncharacterized protein si:ch211-284e13.6 [Electrophorus electricus]
MDNRRRLPLDGGGKPNLSVSAVRVEHVRERVRRDMGDPVTSSHATKEDMSGVPCKVPRFQYVDFPSLHQCIKQLSVPPLQGWLASCPLAKAPACQPSGPKERAPKFKYVDYPSLYHCIQQLSVPPLEIWSSGLTRPSPERQSPSRVLGDQKVNGEAQVAMTEVPVAHQLRNVTPSSGWETGGGGLSEPDHMSRTRSAPRSECNSRVESGFRMELESVAAGDEKAYRPSVISMVHTNRRKHRTMLEEGAEWVEQQEPSDPTAHGQQQVNEEIVCPSGRQMLMEPKEMLSQHHVHKDQTPH